MHIENLLQLKAFSNELLMNLNNDSIVLLSGELGVGKTTLVSYILQALVDENTNFTSPTFNIVNEYYSQKKSCKVFHLDLYRLNDVAELYEIGFLDIINSGMSFIEWPEIALQAINTTLKSRIINIKFSFFNHSIRQIILE
jgi:tRNA threonylcarbamoyladenosine biosynthesis protein TsaE